MKLTSVFTLFDEPTFMAVVDSHPITDWVQPSYWGVGECLLSEYAFYGGPIWTWTGEVLFEPSCSRLSAQDDHRVGPIARLKELWRWLIADTTDLSQRMVSYLGDGRRLPLAQAVRRSNRMAHEAQKTSSENGGDDD